MATVGASQGRTSSVAAPAVVNEVPPSYGYQIEDRGHQITITVPPRYFPDQAVWRVGVVVAISIGGGVGAFTGWAFDPHSGIIPKLDQSVISGFLIGAAFMALLAMIGANRRRNRLLAAHFNATTTVTIDPQCITINGSSVYSRAHVSALATRSTAPRTRFVACSNLVVLGGMLAQSEEEKMARHSHCVTFDYGDQRIVAVGGLTEAPAARIKEAIEAALSRTR